MKLSHTIACALAASAVCVCLPRAAAAEEEAEEAAKPAAADPALKEELSFISALIEANLSDLAEPVIEAAKKKWPNAGPKFKVMEIQGDLSQGKFESVQKTIASLKGKKGKESEYWALRLSMADAYYARAMMAECRKIYEEFFATVKKPGEDLLDFYVESGFKWAQICVREKNLDEAVKMYAGLLSLGEGRLGTERWCMVAMEDVELLLRLAEEIPADPKDKNAKKRDAYLKQAEGLAGKLLWKNELIIVFGKAIAMKAHIEMLRGHPEKAQALVNDYMPQLSEIHHSLVEQDPDGKLGYVRASPMPECRYLLAKALWDGAQAEAKKAKANEDIIKDSLFGARVGGKRNGLGAYNHAINVFVKYPESTWAADAGEMTEAIAAFVKERYKKEIKTNISQDQLKKVRQMQYQNAFDLYRGQDYEKAVAAYKEILARAPESEESVSARGVLADCYINLRQNAKKGSAERADYAKAAEEAEDFVSTQYKGKPEVLVRVAGNETLRLAAKENDMGERGRAQKLYDAYFANYPDHYNAAQMANSLATRAYNDEDWATAIHFYELLATCYPKSPHVVGAMQLLSLCYGKVGNSAKQEEWLRKFAAATPKADSRSAALLNLAIMQQQRAFDGFEAVAETNDVEAAKALHSTAMKAVMGAMRDFNAVQKDVTKTLASPDAKSFDAKTRDQYLLRREQAIYLLGNCLQRAPVKDQNTLSRFRKLAVSTFENYLKLYPKGQYAPQILVKIGTIYTAEKNMEKSQEAFSRLQRDFPESDEAKNSVPRLAKTLIEMGLNSEGVAQYKQMLETPGGKYTAGQFLMAGDALLGAKSWMVAGDAYAKVVELATPLTNAASYLAPALLGQAKASYGAKNYADARQKLDDFIAKYGKTALVIEAYEMLVEVASEEGEREKDDALRMNAFNTAVRAIKRLRSFRENAFNRANAAYEKLKGGKDAAATASARKEMLKLQNMLDRLDLRSGEVQVRKMNAEAAMNLTAAMEETRGKAIVTFQAFIMAHEPTESHPLKDMSAAQLENLEECYFYLLPLMAKHGSEKTDILNYGTKYRQLFPNGKHKQEVELILNPLEGK